jgi:adenine-specific DNA-methyltransferase
MATLSSATRSPEIEPEIRVEHGAVFTKRWIVELILDLAGYTSDRPLGELIAIEPACGRGAFLVPMVERLSDACQRDGLDLGDAVGSIRACDLQPESVFHSRAAVIEALVNRNWSQDHATEFARQAIREDDFLLREPETEVDFVLGNPPYIRLESVPPERSEAYRRRCATMSGRADVYVGFFELGLKALRAGGTLSFVCADRWMKNQYGRLLRQLITRHFSVKAVISMHDVDAFHDDVSAYPSVVAIRRGRQGDTLVADTNIDFNVSAAKALQRWHRGASAGDERETSSFQAAVLAGWFAQEGSWPTGSPSRLAALRDLESRLPLLEDESTGTRVGIGVATGADRVFVTRDKSIVEPDRLLPLAMPADTMSGWLDWSGHYLVNPWRSDGNGLVKLDDFPKLRRYYEGHIDKLQSRNVAKRRPVDDWFRTIDRVNPELTGRSKLLIPDIKAIIHPVLDTGTTYPHHNLYFVVSRDWDLEVLGGLLLSRAAQLFIEAYAVRIRGGYLRFQAQYLRRIRVPRIENVGGLAAEALRDAFRRRDIETATRLSLPLYGLTDVPD